MWPFVVFYDACAGGDVFELEIPFIEVEFVLAHVGGEEDVGQAVVVDIADGYAAAIVEIAEEEAVLVFAVFDFVVEVDAGVCLQFEEGEVVVSGLLFTGGEAGGGTKQNGKHPRKFHHW